MANWIIGLIVLAALCLAAKHVLRSAKNGGCIGCSAGASGCCGCAVPQEKQSKGDKPCCNK